MSKCTSKNIYEDDLFDINHIEDTQDSMYGEDNNSENNQHLNMSPFAVGSFNVFSTIPSVSLDDTTCDKINQLKLNSFTPRRKDELFKRQKKTQEEQIVGRKKEN